jgi:hypothetical protein
LQCYNRVVNIVSIFTIKFGGIVTILNLTIVSIFTVFSIVITIGILPLLQLSALLPLIHTAVKLLRVILFCVKLVLRPKKEFA